VKVAGGADRRDTFFMAVPNKRGPLFLAMSVLAFCAIGLSAWADEIRLKDGKKLYGVIVAYEDSMFKVKTDFGFVLVEKDKIESIIPSTPGQNQNQQRGQRKVQPRQKPRVGHPQSQLTIHSQRLSRRSQRPRMPLP